MFGQVPVYPNLSLRDGIAPPLDAPVVYLGKITRAENKTEPGRRAAEIMAPSSSIRTDGGCPVAQVNDLSRSLTAFDPISTLVVVVEMSKASWLVSGGVPGVVPQPLQKLGSEW